MPTKSLGDLLPAHSLPFNKTNDRTQFFTLQKCPVESSAINSLQHSASSIGNCVGLKINNDYNTAAMDTDLECITVDTSTQNQAEACVIWLHGLGADGHDFAGIVSELQLPKNLAIRFLFPHAPIRPITINGQIPMRAWYDIYSLDDIHREDEYGINASYHLIKSLIEKQLTKRLTSKKIILAGFSQGGAMALYTGLHFTSPLAGILALSCYLPLAQQCKPEDYPSNQQTAILQMHGTFDNVLPVALGKSTYQFLKEKHYAVEWYEYPGQHEYHCPQSRKSAAGLPSA